MTAAVVRVSAPDAVLAQLRELRAEATAAVAARTEQLCAPLHARRPSAAHVVRDLHYGPDPRHRLDIHRPAGPDPAPVLVFVHGGGFVSGNKHLPGSPFYDNVGGWAASAGLLAVTLNYRLAPEHRWPAGAQDVARGAAWVQACIGAYGGNPDRIVLVGQSAGAAHVAGALAGHAGPPAPAAAAVLLSGIYDLPAARRAADPAQVQQLHSYFGADDTAYGQRSALPELLAAGRPLLFGVAELDPPLFQEQARAALNAGGSPLVAPLLRLHGHNHFSPVLTLGADDGALASALTRLVTAAQP